MGKDCMYSVIEELELYLLRRIKQLLLFKYKQNKKKKINDALERIL